MGSSAGRGSPILRDHSAAALSIEEVPGLLAMVTTSMVAHLALLAVMSAISAAVLLPS